MSLFYKYSVISLKIIFSNGVKNDIAIPYDPYYLAALPILCSNLYKVKGKSKLKIVSTF